MIDDMRIFRTTMSIAHVARADERLELQHVMVDTGSEYNWIPRGLLTRLGITPERVDRFETADGRILERDVGFAMLYAGGRSSPTIVVFAEEGDMVLLGAFGLGGAEPPSRPRSSRVRIRRSDSSRRRARRRRGEREVRRAGQRTRPARGGHGSVGQVT